MHPRHGGPCSVMAGGTAVTGPFDPSNLLGDFLPAAVLLLHERSVNEIVANLSAVELEQVITRAISTPLPDLALTGFRHSPR